ncbi:hypothetical protein SISSUDRAFT_965041, partial [Sistotremastrum suecicum HHB10207 ss-3]
WGPFKNEEEWEMGKWLATSGVSQSSMNEFLTLPAIKGLNLSFTSARSLLKAVDALPRGPRWTTFDLKVEGDRSTDLGTPQVETYELYHRNILDCVQDILGDPLLKDHMQYAP